MYKQIAQEIEFLCTTDNSVGSEFPMSALAHAELLCSQHRFRVEHSDPTPVLLGQCLLHVPATPSMSEGGVSVCPQALLGELAQLLCQC